MPTPYKFSTGRRYPHGAIPDQCGVNFSIFGLHATRAELLLYERPDSLEPFQTLRLNPDEHKTFFSWHVYVEDLPVGTCYTWRFDGPRDTRASGFRFNPGKELLDPWARAVTDHFWNRQAASQDDAGTPCSYRALVVDDDGYYWEGERSRSIIRSKIRSFTKSMSGDLRGTYSQRSAMERPLP